MFVSPFPNVLRFDGVVVERESPESHECSLTPTLDNLPVQVGVYDRRILHEAVEAALYCEARPPRSRDLVLADIDGRRWLVMVEPMTDSVAYSAWELAE